jgi:hypothetical protein
MKVSRIFRRLCSKVVFKIWEADVVQDAVIALCMLEKEVPLGFFNIMTHLLIHLVEELFLCGLVHTRWMYMRTLKDYVRTKARLEGSMVEGYRMEDTLGFCNEYMSRFSATRRCIWDDKEEPGLFNEEPEGGGVKRFLSERVRDWAHSSVIDNAGHLTGLRR